MPFLTKFSLALVATGLGPGEPFPPLATVSGAESQPVGSTQNCSSPYVVDGDTVRCGSQRLRLLGIDAPELGHCPNYRQCVAGDGQASKQSLSAGVRQGAFRYQVVTHDRFGRSVVVAWAGGVNLSCWQMSRGQADYKPQWDNGRRIAGECR